MALRLARPCAPLATAARPGEYARRRAHAGRRCARRCQAPGQFLWMTDAGRPVGDRRAGRCSIWRLALRPMDRHRPDLRVQTRLPSPNFPFRTPAWRAVVDRVIPEAYTICASCAKIGNQAAPKRLDRREVIANAAKLLEQGYVDPELGKRLARHDTMTAQVNGGGWHLPAEPRGTRQFGTRRACTKTANAGECCRRLG